MSHFAERQERDRQEAYDLEFSRLQRENAALRAELAMKQGALERISRGEIAIPGLAMKYYGHAMKIADDVLSTPYATAALDRLEALENLLRKADGLLGTWLAGAPPYKGKPQPGDLDTDTRAWLDASAALSPSGSTVDKKGTGSKPIPHTTPGTKYGSGRPE